MYIMETSNVKKNTLANNTPLLSQGALGSLDRSNSLAANPAQQRPACMDQAKSLDVGAKHNSLRKNQANTKPKAFEYDLTGLMKLPNEMKHAIFSSLGQKDLENLFEAVEKHILLGMAAISSAKTICHEAKPWIDLLEIALVSFSQDIYFNTSIYKVLNCAQKLDFKHLFKNSPLLHVDFSCRGLKQFTYSDLKKLLKGRIYGFKSLALKGLKEKELVFSTKCFPKLEALKIEEADALKAFELDDELYTCKNLELLDCKELRRVDVQDAFQLKSFTCTDAKNLEQLSVPSRSRIESFDLSGCSLQNADLTLFTTQLVRFISSLHNLKELNLHNLPITDLSFLKDLTGLETINLSYLSDEEDARLSLNHPLNLSTLNKLKEINLSGRTIRDLSFLSPLKSLEKIDLSAIMLENEAILESLGLLTHLKVLDLRDNEQITDLDFLEPLIQLEVLQLDGCEAMNPESFGVLARLDKLKKLSLASNEQITDLDFLLPLTHIQELSFGNYPSLRVGAWDVLGGLPLLKTLSVVLNAGSGLSDLSFLRDCPHLEALDFSWSFPDMEPEAFNELRHLKQLRKLDLGGTVIKDLAVLEPLVLLQELNISDCELLDEVQLEVFQALRPGCKIINKKTEVRTSYEPQASESEGEEELFWSEEED